MTDHTHTPDPTDEAVTVIYRNQTFTVRPGITVEDAIMACGLSPEAILATRDGKLVTEEVTLRPGDTLKLLATISGG
jgi:sulfur carrier protein ThiS